MLDTLNSPHQCSPHGPHLTQLASQGGPLLMALHQYSLTRRIVAWIRHTHTRNTDTHTPTHPVAHFHSMPHRLVHRGRHQQAVGRPSSHGRGSIDGSITDVLIHGSHKVGLITAPDHRLHAVTLNNTERTPHTPHSASQADVTACTPLVHCESIS
jgi:hypothetical protein